MTTDSVPCSPDDLLRLLAEQEIAFDLVEHPAVFTIEEALAATPSLPGIKTKNVFIRDAKGQRHFLVIVPHDRRLDLPALSKSLSTTKLSMGSAERLGRYLGVSPGSVSFFALLNDRNKAVEVVFDKTVWNADSVQAHPLRNTATMAVSHAAVEVFLAFTGHVPHVIQVP